MLWVNYHSNVGYGLASPGFESLEWDDFLRGKWQRVEHPQISCGDTAEAEAGRAVGHPLVLFALLILVAASFALRICPTNFRVRLRWMCEIATVQRFLQFYNFYSTIRIFNFFFFPQSINYLLRIHLI